jgi:hypothetical protein
MYTKDEYLEKRRNEAGAKKKVCKIEIDILPKEIFIPN